MKSKFISKSIHFITKYKQYSPEEIEKLQYGLEGLYLTITKTIIIFFVSFLLGILKETLIILVFFNILRFTGFGFHASNSLQCFVFSTILFSILPTIVIHFPMSAMVQWIVIFLCFLSLILYAPADTVKRPLPNRKKRIIRKTLTIFTASIYLIIILYDKSSLLSLLLLSALIIQSIMVHPFTYKIFRQPYRNYKNYSAV